VMYCEVTIFHGVLKIPLAYGVLSSKLKLDLYQRRPVVASKGNSNIRTSQAEP
jgi:hypothetical protein